MKETKVFPLTEYECPHFDTQHTMSQYTASGASKEIVNATNWAQCTELSPTKSLQHLRNISQLSGEGNAAQHWEMMDCGGQGEK